MASKRKQLIPETKSHFILVRCPNCGNEQVVFTHSTFPTRCLVCGTPLVTSRGGKVKINAQIIKVLG